MIRRLVRVGLVIGALVVSVGVLPAAPSQAQDQPATTTTAPKSGSKNTPDTPPSDPAIDDLVACVQGSRRLLVLFLIDESASLKQTDPENRRVDAARGALDSLVALATAEGAASPDVDVALAAFSNEYRLVKDWTPADTNTEGALNQSLDEFKTFNKGIDTDFVNALSAGREALADHAAEVNTGRGVPPCRAVLLFTDGGYDIAVRTTKEQNDRLGATKTYAPLVTLDTKENVAVAEFMGRKELCDPGKLADQLRSDDVTLLTVALSGSVARRSQLPLAAATTGRADDYVCGTQPKKGEKARPKGAYLPAEDIDVLLTQFNGVGTRLAGGNLVPGSDAVKICGKEPCPDGTRTFTLDKSLRRAHLLALAPKAGTQVVLEGPDGETATIAKAGESKVGETQVSTREVAGRGFAIDLARPDELASWSGTWRASIIDPTEDQQGDRATLQIYVFSDVGVTFEDGTLIRGEESELKVDLVLPKGVKAKDVVTSSEAVARLRNPITGVIDTVELEGPPTGPFVGTYDTPKETTANAIIGTAEVRIATPSNAVVLTQSAPKELLVQRKDGAIQIAPGVLKMPSLTGKGSTEADLILLGGKAAGCVWFGQVKVPTAPEGIDQVAVTDDGAALPGKADCIQVPAGGQVTIKVKASPDGRASGTVNGNIEVFEVVDGVGESVTHLQFRFDMARGIDETRRLVLAVGLVIGGLGLPLLALLIINSVSARFQALDAVRGSALPVRVTGHQIFRIDAQYPRPLLLNDADFGSLAHAGSDRRFEFGGVEFRARASRNPFGAMTALAAPQGGAQKLKGHEGSRVELDAGLAGSWVFLLDADKTRRAKRGDVEGLLISFVAEGDLDPQTARMLPDIESRAPDTANRLAGLLRTATSKGAPRSGGKGSDGADAGPSDVAGGSVAVAAPPDADAVDADAEVPSAPPGADEPEVPDAPAAPLGFGGAASVDPRELASQPPVDDEPDDDAGPPVGFTGGPR